MAQNSELALAFREGTDPQLPLPSLRLLAPPLRLMSACMWRVAQQRNVRQYGKLAEFITLVTEMVPELLTPRQTAELVLGLRARLILELLQSEAQSDHEEIQEHLNSIHLLTTSSSPAEHEDEEVDDSKVAFVELVRTLTHDPGEKHLFFKNVFPEHYGLRFDTTLQVLVWEFLSRLEEILPVTSFFQLASNFNLDSLDPKLDDFVSDPEDLRTLLHHRHKRSQKLEKNQFSFRSKVILSSLASKQTGLTTRDVFGEEEEGCGRQLSMTQLHGQLSLLGSSLCLEDAMSAHNDAAASSPWGAPVDGGEDAVQLADDEVIGSPRGDTPSPTADGSHSCPQCGESFAGWPDLLAHQAAHGAAPEPASERRLFPCDQCPKRLLSANSLKRHAAAHARTSAAVAAACPQCHKVFKHRSWLREHLRLHTGERPFPCTICGRRFKEKVVLREHLVVHGAVRPYLCSRCGKGYNHRSSLAKHGRVHTGEKPYQCDVCGKRSRTLYMLQEHQKVHTGERPNPCAECGKRFTTPSQLKRHGRTHTGEKPHRCLVCDKRFAERSNMRIHMKVHRR